MASRLEHPVRRRLQGSTSLYEICELELVPGQDELLLFSVRNPRQPEQLRQLTILEACQRLWPELWGEQPVVGAQDVQGMVEVKELQDQIMTDGELTERESARLWQLVRRVQLGEG